MTMLNDLAFSLGDEVVTNPKLPAIKGPVFNQDSTEFFFVNPASRMGPDLIDEYIDSLAAVGVKTFVSCGNGQRTNYPSDVWQWDWEGYEPNGPDTQPLLNVSTGGVPASMDRQRMESLRTLADMGIDFHQQAFRRCRHHGIAAWMSVRMNDVHGCTDHGSPMLSDFYVEQRNLSNVRSPHRLEEMWWSEHALDWERPEVQEHFTKLVCEQLERFDMDGLELDWMRFVYHFRPGRELAGGRELTKWMRFVRERCDRAAKRLGHPVALSVRVPVCPEVARRCGLDAVAWAEAGLVDLVVATPFWATTDFDIPVASWRRQLKGTKAKLAVGLEVRYQPIPNGPVQLITPNLTLGAAANVLSEGADAVYLFNFYPTSISLLREWTWEDFSQTIGALQCLAEIEKQQRTHAVTFRDIRAPGEPAMHALPAWDSRENFQWPPGCLLRVSTGKLPRAGFSARLRLKFDRVPSEISLLKIFCNGRLLAQAVPLSEMEYGYDVPVDHLEEGAQLFELVSDDTFRVIQVEIDFTPLAVR